MTDTIFHLEGLLYIQALDKIIGTPVLYKTEALYKYCICEACRSPTFLSISKASLQVICWDQIQMIHVLSFPNSA